MDNVSMGRFITNDTQTMVLKKLIWQKVYCHMNMPAIHFKNNFKLSARRIAI